MIVDEWHELIGSKRGVQTQLALARLWKFNPALVAWGLSATLGNLQEAMEVLCHPGLDLPRHPGLDPGSIVARPDGLRVEPAMTPAVLSGRTPALVRGRIDKNLIIDTLIPTDPGKYSWAGHLGAQMRQPVVDEIAKSGTTLIFTNVRSQAEIWYQLLLRGPPA